MGPKVIGQYYKKNGIRIISIKGHPDAKREKVSAASPIAYIGVITPEGVIQSNKRKVSLTNAEVWEYGFSKAVWELCPDDWKKPLGNDWQDVLSIILLKQSPTSYIQKTRTVKKESDFRYQFAAQSSSLSRRIYKKWGVGMAELHRLETIYLVCLEKNKSFQKIKKHSV